MVPADKESVKRVKSKRYADLTGVGISDMAVATVKVIVKLLWLIGPDSSTDSSRHPLQLRDHHPT